MGFSFSLLIKRILPHSGLIPLNLTIPRKPQRTPLQNFVAEQTGGRREPREANNPGWKKESTGKPETKHVGVGVENTKGIVGQPPLLNHERPPAIKMGEGKKG